MRGLYTISVCILLLATGHSDESQSNSSSKSADKVAIEEIKKLGAVVGKMKPALGRIADEKIRYVILTKEWEGGDDGLKYIEQISNVRMVFLVGNVKISDERVKELIEAFPKKSVVRRKTDAYLGFSIPPGLDDSKQAGVPIGGVDKNTAADKGGLRIGDLITQFDDKPVKDWGGFLELMDTKKAGDELRLVINRNGESMEMKAKLGTWIPPIEERE